MTKEEVNHAFLDGWQPHLQEHVRTHLKGDLEVAIAMCRGWRYSVQQTSQRLGRKARKGTKAINKTKIDKGEIRT